MNARIFTGTLNGPEGQTVGRWVKVETAMNLMAQIEYLLHGLHMIAQANEHEDTAAIARDVINGYKLSIQGTSN